MLKHNRLQHVHCVHGHSKRQLDLKDTFGLTALLGPHQPSSLRPPLPRPLGRRLVRTAVMNYRFHPPPPPLPPPLLQAPATHINTTHIPDTTTNTNTKFEDQDYTCPHCDSIFNSHIDLVGHLRIHRTETRNQSLEHQPTTCGRQPPAAPHHLTTRHHTLPPSAPSRHTSTSPTASTQLPFPTQVGSVRLDSVSLRHLLHG
nr:unnamed protein product [Spirometra erinaceieuropaei]